MKLLKGKRRKPVLFCLILLVLLAVEALWVRIGHPWFGSVQIVALEVGPFRAEDTVLLRWSGLRLARVMLAKWFSLPRLETRTKESNICASTKVANLRA